MKFSRLSDDVRFRMLMALSARAFSTLAACSRASRTDGIRLTEMLCRRHQRERALRLWVEDSRPQKSAAPSTKTDAQDFGDRPEELKKGERAETLLEAPPNQGRQATDRIDVIHRLPSRVLGLLGLAFLEKAVHPELFYLICLKERLDVVEALFPKGPAEYFASRGVRPRYRHLLAAVRAGSSLILGAMVSMPSFRWSRVTRRQLYLDILKKAPDDRCALLAEQKGWINPGRARYLVLFSRSLPFAHREYEEKDLRQRDWMVQKRAQGLKREWDKPGHGLFAASSASGKTKIRESLIRCFALDGPKLLSLIRCVHEKIGLFPVGGTLGLQRSGPCGISYSPSYEVQIAMETLLLCRNKSLETAEWCVNDLLPIAKNHGRWANNLWSEMGSDEVDGIIKGAPDFETVVRGIELRLQQKFDARVASGKGVLREQGRRGNWHFRRTGRGTVFCGLQTNDVVPRGGPEEGIAVTRPRFYRQVLINCALSMVPGALECLVGFRDVDFNVHPTMWGAEQRESLHDRLMRLGSLEQPTQARLLAPSRTENPVVVPTSPPIQKSKVVANVLSQCVRSPLVHRQLARVIGENGIPLQTTGVTWILQELKHHRNWRDFRLVSKAYRITQQTAPERVTTWTKRYHERKANASRRKRLARNKGLSAPVPLIAGATITPAERCDRESLSPHHLRGATENWSYRRWQKETGKRNNRDREIEDAVVRDRLVLASISG